MLHFLLHSPNQCDYKIFIRNIMKEDEVILLQDGVLAALTSSTALNFLLKKSVPIFVLKKDAEARGLVKYISILTTWIDYDDCVKLTVKHTNQISW
ncbi:MAG: sulfurtransferase complex subunit TusB [Candidatus Dasytiphilus stammeri]